MLGAKAFYCCGSTLAGIETDHVIRKDQLGKPASALLSTCMSTWVWAPLTALHVIHDRQISRHGGASGIRDAALLEMGCT